jgi:hypothetical protein
MAPAETQPGCPRSSVQILLDRILDERRKRSEMKARRPLYYYWMMLKLRVSFWLPRIIWVPSCSHGRLWIGGRPAWNWLRYKLTKRSGAYMQYCFDARTEKVYKIL